MKKIFGFLKKLWPRGEAGISSVEYALLLALIGVAIATAAAGLGSRVASNIQFLP